MKCLNTWVSHAVGSITSALWHRAGYDITVMIKVIFASFSESGIFIYLVEETLVCSDWRRAQVLPRLNSRGGIFCSLVPFSSFCRNSVTFSKHLEVKEIWQCVMRHIVFCTERWLGRRDWPEVLHEGVRVWCGEELWVSDTGEWLSITISSSFFNILSSSDLTTYVFHFCYIVIISSPWLPPLWHHIICIVWLYLHFIPFIYMF